MAQLYRVLVGAITLRGDKLLLLQRSEREGFKPGQWGLPCGKIDFGEALDDAVLRELREEAGLDGRIERICGCSAFMSERSGVHLHNVQVNFIVRSDTGRVTLDRSSQAYQWIDLADYRGSGLDDFTISTIAQALP